MRFLPTRASDTALGHIGDNPIRASAHRIRYFRVSAVVSPEKFRGSHAKSNIGRRGSDQEDFAGIV